MAKHRNERRNREPEKPPVAENPTTAPTEEKLGGKSIKDEVATQLANQVIGKMLWMVADIKAVRRALESLSPTVRGLSNAWPTIVAATVSRIPKKYFGSPELADAFKDIVMDTAKTLNEIVQHSGELKPQDVAEAVDKAYANVMACKLVRDPLGHWHKEDCRDLNLAMSDKSDLLVTTFGAWLEELKKLIDAGETNLPRCSPCCHIGIQADINVSAPQKPSVKRRRSVLEVVGSIKDPDKRREFAEWLESLPADESDLANRGLPEMDSEEEFNAFMELSPSARIARLPLLVERNLKHAIDPYLHSAGVAIKSGAKEMGEKIVAFDRSFVPKVAELKQKREQNAQKRIKDRLEKEKPLTRWQSFWKWFKSFFQMLLPFS